MTDKDLQNDARDAIDPDDLELQITLPYRQVEAALILLDISIDRSDIDAGELEAQRIGLVQTLREALGDIDAADEEDADAGVPDGAGQPGADEAQDAG